ncbi:protein phosphatase 2C domain-containing protein [Chitinophaga filiformis]|uniref:protein phosphatase 2C domain-containing protein n=1 Tax=Chitinophaga filiformis TaxID=104663 RepID=UPI001F1C5EEC|nr:protein phosphatase 2C domain-containing protein [Chitinophaga filiformis]MCF6406922.1 protein phosphatase 2C domain-containing protein [Chitinophaga filiformis]
MKSYTTLQKGEYHLHHCEDYLFLDNINPNTIVCAVMDGCTMGTDSYFISTLTGKILRKIVKAKSYADFYTPSSASPAAQLKDIMRQLFNELNILRNQLQLERNELLTTLLLLVADMKQGQGAILVVGDGLINVNGITTVFDQENKPDYLGYHLSEDFDTWYEKQQCIPVDALQDISLATDGVTSFITLQPSPDTIDPLHFLLIDQGRSETDEMLNMKLKSLEHQYGMKPGDDLAVVRLIW